MDKCISKLAVLLLSVVMNSSLQYVTVSCDEINIIPTPDTPCPGASKGEPCITLQQYIANRTGFNSQNTTLNFYSGNHFLDSQLSISYINSFAMRATKTATIFCSQPYSGYMFAFQGVHTVQIRGITFNGCSVSLDDIENAAIVKSSFVNKTGYTCCNREAVLGAQSSQAGSSVLIKQCVFSDNIGGNGAVYDFTSNLTVDQCTFINNYAAYYEGGAIYKSSGHISILNSHFSHNKGIKDGGAVSILAHQATIANCYFSDNVADGKGGAVVAFAGPVVITNCYFTDNTARSNSSHGGALYAYGSNAGVIITDSYFSDNVAGPISGNGGAVYIEGAGSSNNYRRSRDIQATNQYPNVTISGNTFEYNVASGGGGGAIYSGVRYGTIFLTKNTFSHNTAANCGAVQIFESWFHYNANFIGNVFTHNRATRQVAGGGAVCISKASALVSDNTFSHNTAAGDAGALQVGDCDIVTIERSKFSNNAAQGNGGVIHAYFFSTNYTITHSSFTNNQAGGDGGVMYVESASSQVKIRKSTFSYNHATDRGGVVAINGSTLLISGANICKENNTANLGGVVSACKSKVRISHPKIPSTPDPIHPFCNLYDC